MLIELLNVDKKQKGKCWVCNDKGYIIKDNTIFYCDCCETGVIEGIIQNPISQFFNIEDLISENMFVAKYS